MAITPYIEGKEVAPSKKPVLAKRFVPDDRFRQGTEIKKIQHELIGNYKITSGDGRTTHLLGQPNLGSSVEAEPSNSYIDDENIVPKNVVQDPDFIESIKKNSTRESQSNMDGVIEPLTIRDIATFSSTENPYIAHSIKGQLQSGNENFKLDVDVLSQFVEKIIHKTFEPYLDNGEDFGDKLGNNANQILSLPGFQWEELRKTFGFNDAKYPHKMIKISNKMDKNVRNALLDMNPYTHSYIPEEYTSATTGFIYDSTTDGANSITFGLIG